jgi:predicted dehydrogenase
VYSRTYGKGRVFYTALGYDVRALTAPSFQRLIRRGLAFVTKQLKQQAIRAVVLGYGAAFETGRLHAEALRRIAGFQCIGVCDIDRARRTAAQEQLGEIRTYASVKEVAKDREVDLGVVVTPHNTHAELALALIRAGKHVICERPLAITTKECEQMLKAAKRKKVILSAFHNRRWDGDYVTLRRLVASGAIGEVFHVEIGMGEFRHPGRWWLSEEQVAGSVLHGWGTHLVDWALGLLPGRVTQVDGYLQKKAWHDVTIDDWAGLVMRMEGGQSAMIELGHLTGVSRPKWRVLGTRGSIWGDWGLEHLSVVRYDGGRLVTEKVPVEESQWDAYYRDVADHLLTGSPLDVTPEAASRVIAVIEAATVSARAAKARAVSI